MNFSFSAFMFSSSIHRIIFWYKLSSFPSGRGFNPPDFFSKFVMFTFQARPGYPSRAQESRHFSISFSKSCQDTLPGHKNPDTFQFHFPSPARIPFQGTRIPALFNFIFQVLPGQNLRLATEAV